MRKELIKAIVVVILEESVRNFIPPLLPYAWFVILWLLTWELLQSNKIKGASSALYARLGTGGRMLSFFLVGIVGAGVSIAYWLTIHMAISAAKRASEQTLKSPEPHVSEPPNASNKNPSEIAKITENKPSIHEKTGPHSLAPLSKTPVKQPEQPFAFEEQSPDIFTVELYRGSRAIISRADLTEKGWGPFLLGNERPFSIFLENGNLYAEAKVYKGPGAPAVEVKKNDFVLRPMDWDRNFTDNALAVR